MSSIYGDEDASDDGASSTGTAMTDLDEDRRPWILMDASKCRAVFTHKPSGTRRSCGYGIKCARKDHKVSLTRCDPGYYRMQQPIRKKSPADGDPDTYWSIEDVEAEQLDQHTSDQLLYKEAVTSPGFRRDSERRDDLYAQQEALFHDTAGPPEVYTVAEGSTLQSGTSFASPDPAKASSSNSDSGAHGVSTGVQSTMPSSHVSPPL